MSFGFEFYVSFFATIILLSIPLLVYDYWFSRNSILNSNHEGRSGTTGNSTGNAASCKIIPNSMLLFRGAEYSRFTDLKNQPALTAYDQSLTAKDHQAMFCTDLSEYEDKAAEESHKIITSAWKAESASERIALAKQALGVSENCAPALILLAEEDARTIYEAEDFLRKALLASENQLRKINPHFFQDHGSEFWIRPETRPFVYAKRRLGMCLRKLGRQRDAVKVFKELLILYPAVTRSHLNVQSNLIDVLLDLGLYAEVQKTLDKYEVVMEKSALLFYTTALLRVNEICTNGAFSLESAAERGLSADEMMALDALHRAVEFNPHVPKYLLELKPITLPPEHFVLRGDSEAVAYAFDHMAHWSKCKGALELLAVTWEQSSKLIPKPLESGNRFEPYPEAIMYTDSRLLPPHHELSQFPEDEFPYVYVLVGCLALCIAFAKLLFYWAKLYY